MKTVAGLRKTWNGRFTKNGRSKDPVYAVWEYLFKRIKHKDFDVLKSLLYFYDKHKNKRRDERLFLVAAILLIQGVYNKEKVIVPTGEYEDIIYLDEPIPDYAFDVHTVRGRNMDRGLTHFWDVGAKLANSHHFQGFDEFKRIARALSLQREKEGIRGWKRQRLGKRKERGGSGGDQGKKKKRKFKK